MGFRIFKVHTSCNVCWDKRHHIGIVKSGIKSDNCSLLYYEDLYCPECEKTTKHSCFIDSREAVRDPDLYRFFTSCPDCGNREEYIVDLGAYGYMPPAEHESSRVTVFGHKCAKCGREYNQTIDITPEDKAKDIQCDRFVYEHAYRIDPDEVEDE